MAGEIMADVREIRDELRQEAITKCESELDALREVKTMIRDKREELSKTNPYANDVLYKIEKACVALEQSSYETQYSTENLLHEMLDKAFDKSSENEK